MQVGVEWEIIGKEKLMVDEAAVLVLNHQAGANTHQSEVVCSIADPGCLSLPDPGFRIQNPKSKIQNPKS